MLDQLRLLTIFITHLCLHDHVAAYFGDPSHQEIDLHDWSSGIRVAYCAEVPVSDTGSAFRTALAEFITKYCVNNSTACNLRGAVTFHAESIVFLDGFPRREYSSLNMKFYVVYPHSSRPLSRMARPLLSRALLADILNRHLRELSTRLGWAIIAYERYPRFDKITEFMNIAIIPIIIFSVPLMFFLAYWTSTLRPNSSSESWLVTGSSTGGKNSAYRRTLEIIAEQEAELERQRKIALTGHLLAAPPAGCIKQGSGLLLNVAKLAVEHASLANPPTYSASAPATPRLGGQRSEAGSRRGSDTELKAGSMPAALSTPGSVRKLSAVPEHDILQIEDEEEEDDGGEVAFKPIQQEPEPMHQQQPSSSSTTSLTPPYPNRQRRNSGRRPSSIEEIKQKRRKRGLSISSAGSGPRQSTQWKAGSLVLFGGRR